MPAYFMKTIVEEQKFENIQNDVTNQERERGVEIGK
jgi:hypothetical protein